MRKRRRIYINMMVLLGALLFLACKPTVPKQYIQPDEMEDLLYDYHLALGAASVGPHGENQSDEYRRQLYLNAVLKKYEVSRANFDSSLVYYYTRADRFRDIYNRLQKRLADEALAMGASANEVEMFTSLAQNGDTADVWTGDRRYLLTPHPMCHVAQFEQDADTTYHHGDAFMLTFNTQYIVQSGTKSAQAHLVMTYENDSTVTVTQNITAQTIQKMRVAKCAERLKHVKGYFYMAPRSENDNVNDLCMLIVDNVHLVRFHEQPDEPKPAPTAPDTIQQEKPTVDTMIVSTMNNKPQKMTIEPITKK